MARVNAATGCAYTTTNTNPGHQQHVHAPTEWWQYSDGHWEGEDQEADLDHCPPAGWGTVELRRVEEADARADAANTNLGPQTSRNQQDSEGTASVNFDNVPIAQFSGDGPDWRGGRAQITAAACGGVPTEPEEKGYIGANAQTNNTGELTGMYEMICRALARPRGSGREALCTDSLYAKHMTTGHWTPRVKRNAGMIRRLRNKWRELRRTRPGEVRIEHVRSHTMVLGNEIADWLAERGATEQGVTPAQMATWIEKWAATRRASERGRPRRRTERGHPPTPSRGDG
jgi:ribonuclease HI